MGQRHSVSLTMRNAIARAELMSNGMNISDANLIDRNACMIGSHRHPLARVNVIRMINRPLKPPEYTLYGESTIFFAGPPVPDADIGLNAVCQCVDTSSRRDRGG